MYLSHPRAIKAVSAMEPTTCLSSRRPLCCEVGNLCFSSVFIIIEKNHGDFAKGVWYFEILLNIVVTSIDETWKTTVREAEADHHVQVSSQEGEQEEKLHAHRKCCSHDRTRGEENTLDVKRDLLLAQFPAEFSSCPRRKFRKARGSWISFVTL